MQKLFRKSMVFQKPTEAQAKEMFAAARENGVYLMEAAYITSDYNKTNICMRKDTLGGCTYDLGVYNSSLILRMLWD